MPQLRTPTRQIVSHSIETTKTRICVSALTSREGWKYESRDSNNECKRSLFQWWKNSVTDQLDLPRELKHKRLIIFSLRKTQLQEAHQRTFTSISPKQRGQRGVHNNTSYILPPLLRFSDTTLVHQHKAIDFVRAQRLEVPGSK